MGVENIRSGKIDVTSAIQPLNSAIVNPNIKTKASAASSVTDKSGPYLNSVQPNPLETYSSYNALWTLACLTPAQYNNPSLYRNTGELSNVVLSSADRYATDRVNTSSGAPAYYIDDVQIRSVISPSPAIGNSYATEFAFKIYEPYSMGLFLQSLQTAARLSRYPDYHNAPFVLKLDYIGYNELGQTLTPTDASSIRSKYFVIKITEATFAVNSSGSEYDVKGYPFNHDAYNDVTSIIYNDMSFRGSSEGTVADVLKTSENSFLSALNSIENNLVNNKQVLIPDVYDIQFPTAASVFTPVSPPNNQNSATATPGSAPAKSVGSPDLIQTTVELDVNPIGAATFGFDQSTGGNYPFLDENTELTDSGALRRFNLTIDPDTRQFQFSQGQSILNIIERVITSSSYAVNAQNAENKIDGFILYYRVDVQTEFLEFDELIGDYARKFTFRIVPYYVHESIYLNSNAAPAGYKEIENRVIKHYQYIYTGQNVDVLNFEMKIRNLFYTGFRPSTDNPKTSDPGTSGIAPDDTDTIKTGQGSSPGALFNNNGRRRLKPDPELLKAGAEGGVGEKSIAIQVAEAFHRAFITGSTGDLITVDLEILGDPYWLSDSGIANYFAKPAGVLSQLTTDGTMNYEAGEVFTYITFKTAVDVNETSGLYDFSIQNSTSPFSGIYRITQVEHTFSKGQFTQILKCVRMIGQSLDFDDDAADQQTLTDQEKQPMVLTTVPKQKTSPFNDETYISGFWDDE